MSYGQKINEPGSLICSNFKTLDSNEDVCIADQLLQ